MDIPLDIIVERMKLYDPDDIIELLGITSEELIARFMDRIEMNEEYLREEFELFGLTAEEEEFYDIDSEEK